MSSLDCGISNTIERTSGSDVNCVRSVKEPAFCQHHIAPGTEIEIQPKVGLQNVLENRLAEDDDLLVM
jgi:hypothetical protein